MLELSDAGVKNRWIEKKLCVVSINMFFSFFVLLLISRIKMNIDSWLKHTTYTGITGRKVIVTFNPDSARC